MAKKKTKKEASAADPAAKLTRWVGSGTSLYAHTGAFALFFLLGAFGAAGWDTVLLVLTTLVSLEAIYLSIFIQMTVNRNTQSLLEVEEDIDDIQEDVEDISEELEEMSEDVEELQEDVEEMSEEEKEEEARTKKTEERLERIQDGLRKLMEDFEKLKGDKQ